MERKIFVRDFCVFRPGPENPGESPKLEGVDPLFKRRLSQISRMAIHVVGAVLPSAHDSPLFFASFRGEISRQLRINRGLCDDFSVSPAQFSISTFNTPPAAATIAHKMKAGYTAVYPSNADFSSALLAAEAGILCGRQERLIFCYADELIPEEYRNLKFNGIPQEELNLAPLALACVLSAEKSENGVEIPSVRFKTPHEFADFLERNLGAEN